MRIYILLLLTTTLLIASENQEIEIECSDLNNEEVKIKIESNSLSPSEDAIMDNLGGYVDIPQEKFYIRSKNKLYKLNGVVETNYKTNMNVFSASLSLDSFNKMKKEIDLKFIQKTDLLENNKEQSIQNITTKNILNVYFEKSCK